MICHVQSHHCDLILSVYVLCHLPTAGIALLSVFLSVRLHAYVARVDMCAGVCVH